MDDLDFHDARIRITRLLTEQDRLCARLEATERASNRLLQEVNELRRELDALQSENDGLRRVLNEALPRLRAPLPLPAEPSYS